jgi:hypothetical protein
LCGPVDDDLVVPCEIYSHVSCQTPGHFSYPLLNMILPLDTSGELFVDRSWNGKGVWYLICLHVLNYRQLFVGGIMSCLRYLCLRVHSGVQHTLCCVFALFFFVLCALCCQFLWIVNIWLPLRYSLTFIYYTTCISNGFSWRFRTRFFSNTTHPVIQMYVRVSIHLLTLT